MARTWKERGEWMDKHDGVVMAPESHLFRCHYLKGYCRVTSACGSAIEAIEEAMDECERLERLAARIAADEKAKATERSPVAAMLNRYRNCSVKFYRDATSGITDDYANAIAQQVALWRKEAASAQGMRYRKESPHYDPAIDGNLVGESQAYERCARDLEGTP